MDIVKYIPIGKENAITTKELMSATGIPMRKLRQLIYNARVEGAVILTDLKTGYWLPDLSKPEKTIQELKHFKRLNVSNISNRYQTIESAQYLLTELEQKSQLKLEELPTNAEKEKQKI